MTNKSVLISIRPKWCEMIANGEKILEVRKTRPKLKPPFKVYIYCCKPVGRVIGEFICDTFVTDKTFGHDPLFNGAACMDEVECATYSCCTPLYGWHISNLIIYDTPKALSEFALKRPPQSWCYVEELDGDDHAQK